MGGGREGREILRKVLVSAFLYFTQNWKSKSLLPHLKLVDLLCLCPSPFSDLLNEVYLQFFKIAIMDVLCH